MTEKKRGSLHQLLAVEPELKSAAVKSIRDASTTFSRKQGQFYGQHRSYEPDTEEGQRFPDENEEMVSTVYRELDDASKKIVRYVDALIQKETTNAEAKAHVLIEGQSFFGRALPATALLALEGKLKELREMYEEIPVLDPKEEWSWDPQTKRYLAKSRQYIKTEKQLRAVVLYEATKEHPAQVKDYTQDIRIGVWTNKRFSGAIPPAEKSDLIERLDTLMQAVKSARQKANDEEVTDIMVGDTIFRFLHQPLKK